MFILSFKILVVIYLTFKSIIMKKSLCVFSLILFLPLLFNSCKPKVDIGKEKEAIISLIEAEKKAFFDRDTALMETLWVHDSTARKLYLGQKNLVEFNGWAEVHAHDLENAVSDAIWDNAENLNVDFSDYEINLYENSALVYCISRWSGEYQGKKMDSEAKRILHMVKTDGTWKYDLMAIYSLPQPEEPEAEEEGQ